MQTSVKAVNAWKRFAHYTYALESRNALTALTDICIQDSSLLLYIQASPIGGWGVPTPYPP